MATENATPSIARARRPWAPVFVGCHFGNRHTLLAVGETCLRDELEGHRREMTFAARACVALLYKAAATGENVDDLYGALVGLDMLLNMANVFDETAREAKA